MSAIIHIEPRNADLGDGMMVRRVLPSRQQRMIGAWCFLDHAGPVHFAADQGMHVGAHPHIGLQTFTWLIEGEVLHRDSLGNEQIIRPGQVNLMTAGRGIVHTEDSLHDGQRLHAAQLWIALPAGQENCAPDFSHHPELPQWQEGATRLTLLAGTYAQKTAQPRVHSPLLGLDITSAAATEFRLDLNPSFEYGVLPLVGEIAIDGERLATDELAYLSRGRTQMKLDLSAGARILVLGGEPFAQPIVMWWNFVGHDKAAIAAAQREWESGGPRFGRVKGDNGRRLVAPPLPWSGY